MKLNQQHWVSVVSLKHLPRDDGLREDRIWLNHLIALVNLTLIRNLNGHAFSRESWDIRLPGLLERLAANQDVF